MLKHLLPCVYLTPLAGPGDGVGDGDGAGGVGAGGVGAGAGGVGAGGTGVGVGVGGTGAGPLTMPLVQCVWLELTGVPFFKPQVEAPGVKVKCVHSGSALQARQHPSMSDTVVFLMFVPPKQVFSLVSNGH